MRLSSLELPSIFPSFDLSAQDQHVLNTSPEKPLELSRTIEVVTPEVVGVINDDPLITLEQVGEFVGIWFGMVYGLATLPVVAVDGPLPFLDAAWAWTTYRVTRRGQQVGGAIGKEIDEIIA